MLPWIIALLIAGIALLLIELFIPGFGIFGITGLILCTISSIIIAYSYGPAALCVELILLAFIAALLFRALKKNKAFKKIILEESLSAQGFDENLISGLMNKEGITTTDLKPYGKACFDGTEADVFSNGGYIYKDKAVKVIAIKGKNVIVKELSE